MISSKVEGNKYVRLIQERTFRTVTAVKDESVKEKKKLLSKASRVRLNVKKIFWKEENFYKGDKKKSYNFKVKFSKNLRFPSPFNLSNQSTLLRHWSS